MSEHLHAKVTAALASDSSLTAARPLCEVIEFLAAQDATLIQDALGKALGIQLLSFLLNSAKAPVLRRWSGLLLFELCRRSQSTVSLLAERKTSQLHGLGRIVQLQDDKEDVMLVCCMIMGELAADNVDQRLFWPSQTEGAQFVRGDPQEWMIGLQSVLDGFSESQASQANVFYPRGVQAGQDIYFDEHRGRLLMLIEDRLTVVIVPPAALHTFYVDIPFENIHEATVSSECELRLDLVSASSPWTYVVNSKPYDTKSILVEMAVAADAKHVMNEIQQRCNLEATSHRHDSRSCRSSSAALVFDGTPRSDDMDFMPPTSPNRDMKVARDDPERSAAETTTSLSDDLSHPSTKDTKIRTEQELDIYSFPGESPEPALKPEHPRKTKGQGDHGNVQFRERRSIETATRGRKYQRSRRKKGQEGKRGRSDDEFQPGKQQKVDCTKSVRVTRASEAQRLHAEGRAHSHAAESTVPEQVGVPRPEPKDDFPAAQQSVAGYEQEAHTIAAENKIRYRSESPDRKWERFQKSSQREGESEENAVIVGSDKSDTSSLMQDESTKAGRDINQPDRLLVKTENEQLLEDETGSAGEPTNLMTNLRVGREKLIDRRTAYDLHGPLNQGYRSADNTPGLANSIPSTYSAGKSKRRGEKDKFSSLIEEEDDLPKKTSPPGSVLPIKRPAGSDTSQGREKRRSTERDGNRMEHSTLEHSVKEHDDNAEPAENRTASSPTSGGPLEGIADIEAPVGSPSSPFVGQSRSSKFDLGSSPLASHRNLHLSNAISSRNVVTMEDSILHIGPKVDTLPRSRVENSSSSRKHQLGDDAARRQEEHIKHADVMLVLGEHTVSPNVPKASPRARPRPKQVLSSNRKKEPEPPEIDSKAITTHVSQQMLTTSKSLQTPAQPLMDPFNGQTPTPGRPGDETKFMRNLRKQMQNNASVARVKGADKSLTEGECTDDEDPDRTLIEMVEDALEVDSVEDKSSTAVASVTDVERDRHREKMEWENCLKPHQRDMFNVLARISRHFVRHLVSTEAAIEDILLGYEADGTRLIELMEESHRKEYDAQRKCLLATRTHISEALFHIKEQVVEHEEHAQASLLDSSWEKEASASKNHVYGLEKMLNHTVEQ